MTRIKATCPTCGEVELLPSDMYLSVDGYDLDDVGDGSYYQFECPKCRGDIEKPADQRIARLLVAGGVDAAYVASAETYVEIMADIARHTHPDAGLILAPPLTHDDLLNLHLLLETDHWFSQLAGTVAL